MTTNTENEKTMQQKEQISKLSDQELEKVAGGAPAYYIEPNDQNVKKKYKL